MELLLNLGVTEIIVAFDRQFEQIGDDEFKRLTKKLKKMNDKYKSTITLSFIFDKDLYTDYKDSPIDKGAEMFIKLYSKRIFL